MKPLRTLRSWCRTQLRKLWFRLVLYFLAVAVIAIFLIVDTIGERERLISASGIVFLISLAALGSKHRRF